MGASKDNSNHEKRVSIAEIVEKTLMEIEEWKNKKPRYSPRYSGPLRGRYPFNPVTGKKYNGWNAFMLLHIARRQWFGDHRWLTSAQITEVWENQGKQTPIHVRLGETATYIARPVFEKDEHVRKKEDSLTRKQRKLKELEEPPQVLFDGGVENFIIYPVFNASQINNFPHFAEAGFKDKAHRNEILDKFIAAAGVKVRHSYDPICPVYEATEDIIIMPYPKAYAKNPDAYYADKMHEFFHATAHPKRENRCAYSQDEEEVSAELFSIMVANMLDLPFSKKNAAGYLLPYHRAAIKDNKRGVQELVWQPAKILSLLDDFIGGVEPAVEWFPGKGKWEKLYREQAAKDRDLWSQSEK